MGAGFEGALVRICGTGWKDLTGTNRQVWMSQRQEFVAEAVRILGGPRLARSHGEQDIAGAIPAVSLNSFEFAFLGELAL